MTSVGWVVPAADAVTLGELGGALYSVSPRDEAHLGDEFVRRGGAVLPPARVALSGKARRAFGRDESLTQELEADARDSGAVRMLKRAAGAAAAFLTSDELDVLQGVLDALRAGVRRITGGDDQVDDAERDEVARAKESVEAVAAIGWHPSLSVLAVAQRDHVVSFYDVATAKWDARVLEHRAQADISAVQWAPHSGGVLAVACRGGVFLWKVAVKKAGEEPVLVEVVKHPRKISFHQLSWNADGSLLAAFAKNSSSVIVFDAIRSRSTELQCPYPPASLHWCPTGEYLFATTHRGVSVMWEALTWKREVWEVSASACAWSGNGRCLLVSQRNSPLLFPYLFEDSPPSMDARINSPAIDFSEKLLSSLDKSASAFVGGKVERMTWDPTGRRVALIFSPTTVAPEKDSSSRLVAIFSITWEPYLIFTQSGLLRGPPSSGVPRHVAFASSFEHGALLSVAWSSGLVSFYPFYLEDPLQSS